MQLANVSGNPDKRKPLETLAGLEGRLAYPSHGVTAQMDTSRTLACVTFESFNTLKGQCPAEFELASGRYTLQGALRIAAKMRENDPVGDETAPESCRTVLTRRVAS